MRRPSRTLLAAATVALLLGVTACGADDDTVPATADASDAAGQAPGEATAGSTTEQSETTETAEPTEEPEPTEAPVGAPGGYTAEQLLRAMKRAVREDRSAHFTMTMSAGGQEVTAEGDLDYTPRGPEMRMSMAGAAMGVGQIRMRLVDGVMYLAIPRMTPKGKFLSIDTNDPDSPYAAMGLGQMDPVSTFDAFDAGLRKVRYVGEEHVSGEAMDHYRLTVDTGAATRAQGRPRVPGMPKRLAYHLWLDDADRMRKVTFDVDGLVAMDMTMSDWGKKVAVQAPPARKVVEAPTR